MNREFLSNVEKQIEKLTQKQNILINQMIEKLAQIDHQYENPIYYSKQVKDKEQQPPLRLFTVGVKERPFNFYSISLNLDTDEMKYTKSKVEEKFVGKESLKDPLGNTASFKPYEKKYVVQNVSQLE